MKRVVHLRALALTALLAATMAVAAEPRANGWAGLERRITRDQAYAILQATEGAPLIITHSRDRRFEVWNYDRGAYLLFIEGVLDYWIEPRDPGEATTDTSSK